MAAGIRTNELRKVYNSPPPLAAGSGGFSFAEKRSKGKQPKPEIVALNGISLDIPSGEIFCLLGPNGAGKSTTVGVLTTRVRPTAARPGSVNMMSGKSSRRQAPDRRGRPAAQSRFFSDRSRNSRFSRRLFWPGRSRAQPSAPNHSSTDSNSAIAPIKWFVDFPAA